MKVLFNCTNNVVGGAIQNSANFIKYATKDKEIDYHFLASHQVADVLEKWGVKSPNLIVLDSPAKSKSSRARALELESQLRPDLVYTMAGPTYINFKSFHVMGTSDPYITHSKFENFKRNRSFSKFIVFSLKIAAKALSARFGADYFLFQTETSRNGFCSRYFWSKHKTDIVPNALGEDFFNSEHDKSAEVLDKVKVFCPSAYYPHKNLEVVFDLANAFKNNNRFKFIVTTPSDSSFSRKISESNFTNIENIGPFSYVDAAKLYSESDIVLMPSLLETFSTSYLEAISFEKPLIVADTEFSREICEEYAIYFDSNNKASLASSLERGVALIGKIDKKLRKRIIEKYGTQEQRYQKIKNIILELAKSRS